jgi:hypothetical protein
MTAHVGSACEVSTTVARGTGMGFAAAMRATSLNPGEGTTITDVAELRALTAKRLRQAAAQQERWRTERDKLIYEAHMTGIGVHEIARLIGMTHPGVLAILARQRDEEAVSV